MSTWVCVYTTYTWTMRFNYNSEEPPKTASLIQTLSILQQSHVLNIPHQLEISKHPLWPYSSASFHICECYWCSTTCLVIYLCGFLTDSISFNCQVMALPSFTHFLSNLNTLWIFKSAFIFQIFLIKGAFDFTSEKNVKCRHVKVNYVCMSSAVQ